MNYHWGMVWEWNGRLGIRTVLVSLNLNGFALGSVSHTCASKHPHPIPGPFHQLVNYEFPRVRILNLYDRRLAVRPDFWDIENLVVRNHPVLLILRRGLPDNSQGGGGLRVSIHHLWRSSWHCGEKGERWVRTFKVFWTRQQEYQRHHLWTETTLHVARRDTFESRGPISVRLLLRRGWIYASV